MGADDLNGGTDRKDVDKSGIVMEIISVADMGWLVELSESVPDKRVFYGDIEYRITACNSGSIYITHDGGVTIFSAVASFARDDGVQITIFASADDNDSLKGIEWLRDFITGAKTLAEIAYETTQEQTLGSGDAGGTLNAVQGVVDEITLLSSVSEEVFSRVSSFLNMGCQDVLLNDKRFLFEVQDVGGGDMVIAFTDHKAQHCGINVFSDGRVSFVAPVENEYRDFAAADFVSTLFDSKKGFMVNEG